MSSSYRTWGSAVELWNALIKPVETLQAASAWGSSCMRGYTDQSAAGPPAASLAPLARSHWDFGGSWLLCQLAFTVSATGKHEKTLFGVAAVLTGQKGHVGVGRRPPRRMPPRIPCLAGGACRVAACQSVCTKALLCLESKS